MSPNPKQELDPETYRAAMKHEAEASITRSVAIALAVVLLTFLAGVTYCGSRPSVEQQCVAAGGSYMPIKTAYNTDHVAIYTDSCVRPDAVRYVPTDVDGKVAGGAS